MTGSSNQSKTSKLVENQLPLKGYTTPYVEATTGREFLIEGMGDGRYRIITPKRQRGKK